MRLECVHVECIALIHSVWCTLWTEKAKETVTVISVGRLCIARVFRMKREELKRDECTRAFE